MTPTAVLRATALTTILALCGQPGPEPESILAAAEAAVDGARPAAEDRGIELAMDDGAGPSGRHRRLQEAGL